LYEALFSGKTLKKEIVKTCIGNSESSKRYTSTTLLSVKGARTEEKFRQQTTEKL